MRSCFKLSVAIQYHRQHILDERFRVIFFLIPVFSSFSQLYLVFGRKINSLGENLSSVPSYTAKRRKNSCSFFRRSLSPSVIFLFILIHPLVSDDADIFSVGGFLRVAGTAAAGADAEVISVDVERR